MNCYKGKYDALYRGNYRVIKLLVHIMKVLEYVLESLICSQIDINNMQFGFMPERSTIDMYTFFVKCRRNILLGRKKSASLLLNLKRPLPEHVALHFDEL